MTSDGIAGACSGGGATGCAALICRPKKYSAHEDDCCRCIAGMLAGWVAACVCERDSVCASVAVAAFLMTLARAPRRVAMKHATHDSNNRRKMRRGVEEPTTSHSEISITSYKSPRLEAARSSRDIGRAPATSTSDRVNIMAAL
eukprot:1631587-Pleurochrysis_carterae.AAC.2